MCYGRSQVFRLRVTYHPLPSDNISSVGPGSTEVSYQRDHITYPTTMRETVQDVLETECRSPAGLHSANHAKPQRCRRGPGWEISVRKPNTKAVPIRYRVPPDRPPSSKHDAFRTWKPKAERRPNPTLVLRTTTRYFSTVSVCTSTRTDSRVGVYE